MLSAAGAQMPSSSTVSRSSAPGSNEPSGASSKTATGVAQHVALPQRPGGFLRAGLAGVAQHASGVNLAPSVEQLAAPARVAGRGDHCATLCSTMAESVGVRELRQNLSKYLARVKRGQTLTVTEHGRDVAALVPRGTGTEAYDDLVTRFGVSVPTESLEVVAARLPHVAAPAGATDAFLAESRSRRA